MNDDLTTDSNKVEISAENIKLQTISPVSSKKKENHPRKIEKDIEPVSNDEEIEEVEEKEIEEVEEVEEVTKELPTIDSTNFSTQMLYFRNIYSILSLQFALMFSLFLLSFYSETYRNFLFNSGILYFFCWGLSLFLIVLFYYRKRLKYKHPYNKILLALLTLTLSYNVSFMGATESPYHVYAGILTMFIYFLLLTLFANVEYKNFNLSNQLMLFAVIAVFTFSVFATITHGAGIGNMVVSMMVTGLICILISCYIQIVLPMDYTEIDVLPSAISVYTSVIGFIVNVSTALYEYISEHWPY